MVLQQMQTTGWVEYQLTLNPVLLRSGIPVYQHMKNKADLKLVNKCVIPISGFSRG
jgi:hypothetical protein